MSTNPNSQSASLPTEPASRGYSRYVLGTMFMLTALNVMDRQVLSVLVEPVKGEFGLSDAQMGILMGNAFAFSHVIAMVPVGRLADMGSRRNVIAAGIFLWSTLTAFTGASRTYWHLFLTRVGVGACETVGSGPAQSLLADYFPVERRGTALSVHASGGTFGAMLGFAIGGVLADQVGWRWTFVCFGVPGIALAALIMATVREPARGAADGVAPEPQHSTGHRDAAETHAPPGLMEVLRHLGRLSSFRHVVVAGSLNSFANWALLSWAAAAMMRAHDLTATEAGGRIAASVTLFSALGLIVAGFVTDRLGRRDLRWYLWFPGLASLLAYPFLAAFLLTSDPTLAFLIVIPGAFLNTMWVGTFNAAVHMLASPDMRSTSAALFALITSGLIGQGLGPAFVGLVSDFLGPQYGDDSLRYALAIAVAASLGAAAFSVLAGRRFISERYHASP